jgi:fused signal recognition particle receptor
VLLVLDATTGQIAILQAQNFGKAVNVTGIILAKLDGTAKGGVVLAIRDQLQIPVKFIGLGETPEDIETFDPARFINALFGDQPAQ